MSITPYSRSIKESLQTRSFGIDEYQREHESDSSNMGSALVLDVANMVWSPLKLGVFG